MTDRKVQLGDDAAAGEHEIARLRDDLEVQVENFNTKVAGGKWNHMMPGLVTGKDLTAWSSQVRWPWGEKAAKYPAMTNEPPSGQNWRDAATANNDSSEGAARWTAVEGLGPSGCALALLPANLENSWKQDDKSAPSLEYNFQSKDGDAEAFIDFLPTFRICPGMKLRVAVGVDDQASVLVEVPGSSGAENENGTVRSSAVQNNYTRARVPLPALAAGKHIFKIHAVDPGVVIDRVSLP
jgi:hypothetical protein